MLLAAGLAPPVKPSPPGSLGRASNTSYTSSAGAYVQPASDMHVDHVLLTAWMPGQGRVDYVGSTASMEYSFQQPCS